MTTAFVPEVWTKSLLALAMVSPRTLVAFAMLPFFGKQSVTRLMLAAITSVLVLPIIPAVAAQLPPEVNMAWLFGIILKECAIGLIIGFVCSIPFWAAQSMGFFIDNQRGASSAQISDPSTSQMTTPLGVLFGQVFNILFLIAGGLHLFLTLMYNSYLTWSVVEWMPVFNAGFSVYMLDLMDALMRLALMLAAPAVIAMLLSEIALAYVSLFAPQLQVFFLAMSVKSGVAIFILLIYLATIAEIMTSQTQEILGILPALKEVMQ